MSRRKKRTVSPEVQAAYITARATEVSAVIMANATVTSAGISASGSRSAARIGGLFTLGAAGLAGAVALALSPATPPSDPPGRAGGSVDKRQGTRTTQAEQLLDQQEREAVMVQLRFRDELEADCTLYESHDSRMACVNKKAAARDAVRAHQTHLSALRRLLEKPLGERGSVTRV
ncbi:hypothetical protein [Micromonospora aurantiaca]|uniref:hypothetical protein n=1 Tax=Micromonospora aurantiaca (nom. illeg.) TaxID=47850 RepID=UPI002E1870D4